MCDLVKGNHMQVTSWSKNESTGRYEGYGYDDLGNLVKYQEYEQLALPLPEPEKPPRQPWDLPQEDE